MCDTCGAKVGTTITINLNDEELCFCSMECILRYIHSRNLQEAIV